MKWLPCIFWLHLWVDDDQQERDRRHQHCAYCPARRTIERESFYR